MRKYFWFLKRIFERFVVMYTPFLSSVFYVIHTMLLKNEVYDSLFFGYNSNFFGHSIFWLYVVLIRSKNMCKWYKLSIKSSMVMNFLNILPSHNRKNWTTGYGFGVFYYIYFMLADFCFYL